MESENIDTLPWLKMAHYMKIFSRKAESLSAGGKIFSAGPCKPKLTRLKCWKISAKYADFDIRLGFTKKTCKKQTVKVSLSVRRGYRTFLWINTLLLFGMIILLFFFRFLLRFCVTPDENHWLSENNRNKLFLKHMIYM